MCPALGTASAAHCAVPGPAWLRSARLRASHDGAASRVPPALCVVQVKASRKIKKLLTGRLYSAVSTYPAFPGDESNYLRALIARIGAATVVAPADLFSFNDETGELERSEEWEAPGSGRDFAAPSAWVHT
jgi:radial spoke head protein 4A